MPAAPARGYCIHEPCHLLGCGHPRLGHAEARRSRWRVLPALGRRLLAARFGNIRAGNSGHEVRRELLRAGKAESVSRLDAFNAAEPHRYIPLTTESMRKAA